MSEDNQCSRQALRKIFWVKAAYRIPDNPCGCVPPGSVLEKTISISRMTTRSLIVEPATAAVIAAERPAEIRGIAFSSGLAASGRERKIVLPPEQMDLRPGKGLERVLANCLLCHGADYITVQPPFSRAQWTAEVAKMIKVMGAVISDDDVRIISDYLVDNEGK